MAYDARYDLNNDGVIDELDSAIFQSYYGTVVNYDDPLSVACDFNEDGVINDADWEMMAPYLGECPQCPFPWGWVILAGIGGLVLGAMREEKGK